MDEQTRAFEAAWAKKDFLISPAMKEFAKDWYLKGLKHEHCERPKATPLVVEDRSTETFPRTDFQHVIRTWCKDNAIPEGTKIRVTAEEV
jgi:hypothetical protein